MISKKKVNQLSCDERVGGLLINTFVSFLFPEDVPHDVFRCTRMWDLGKRNTILQQRQFSLGFGSRFFFFSCCSFSFSFISLLLTHSHTAAEHFAPFAFAFVCRFDDTGRLFLGSNSTFAHKKQQRGKCILQLLL